MSEPGSLREFCCPGCDAPIDEQWVACPKCGTRLRPADDLFVRSAIWIMLLGAYVFATLLIYKEDRQAGITFGVLCGLPLVYLFGKAVLFRLRGRPLTWKELGWTSFRVALVGVFVTVVLPMIIGMAMIVLLFAVCGTMMLRGQF
jgi:hypothetical protein